MRRLVTIGAALAVLLGVSGCARTPESVIEPKAGSSAPPSSAPRPASTLTPPVLPKQAESNDATGAASFAGYWIHTLNVSVANANPDAIDLLSMAACEGCARYARRIDLDRRRGIASVGFKWTPQSVRFNNESSVMVTVSAARYRRVGPDRVVDVPATEYQLGFALSWTDDRWLVHELYVP